jgi:RNA polymerase sigma factor (sigma-70 family)
MSEHDSAAAHPLADAAEVAMVLAAQRGPGRDRDRLVERYLPLIGSLARTYAGTANVDRAELMQEGVVGVLRALRRYDPEIGTSFWAYASWWVRQAMQQLVSEMARPIVLSDRALRQLARLKAAERAFAQAHGREPSSSELAEATGFSLAQVESLMLAARRPRALEERIGGDAEGTSLGDRVPDPRAEDAFDRVPLRIATRDLPGLLATLDERQRHVIRARFGLDGEVRTLRELADCLGVSAERVRQIEEGSLRRCREAAGP